MNKYIFSDEEINKILLSSPMALPNSPSSYGLRGSNIKEFFYEYIRKLMLLINDHFQRIENDKDSSILAHDTDTNAHSDVITDLIAKDVELGTAITNHYTESSNQVLSLKSKIDSDIEAHSEDTVAHQDIRQQLASTLRKAENAYNLASGKSRIIPVKNINEMINNLSSSLNVGDKFVLSDTNVPDFTLFEKNSLNSEAIPITVIDVLFDTVNPKPGKSYIYNGYLLVASESGLDTSELAKQTDLEELDDALAQQKIELQTSIDGIALALDTKENVIRQVDETAENITISDDTEYNLGLRTSIKLELPNEIPKDFNCIVNFRSGATKTAFYAPGNIIFTQDDCYGGVLTPMSNRIYEIHIKSVGGVLIGKVGCCDYTVV